MSSNVTPYISVMCSVFRGNTWYQMLANVRYQFLCLGCLGQWFPLIVQAADNHMLLHCISVPGVGLTPTEQPSKDHLSKALAVAYKSTASIGRFTEKLPKEKPTKFSGKKRKVCNKVSLQLVFCFVGTMQPKRAKERAWSYRKC